MSHRLAGRLGPGLIALVAIAFTFAPAAVAQPGPATPDAPPGLMRGPGGPGILGHLRFLDLYLELTDDQRTEARALFEARHGELAALRREMRTVRAELAEHLEGANPDPTTIGTLTLELKTLRGELHQELTDLREAFRGLLTLEQQSKLDHLHEARQVRRELRQRGARRGRQP